MAIRQIILDLASYFGDGETSTQAAFAEVVAALDRAEAAIIDGEDQMRRKLRDIRAFSATSGGETKISRLIQSFLETYEEAFNVERKLVQLTRDYADLLSELIEVSPFGELEVYSDGLTDFQMAAAILEDMRLSLDQDRYEYLIELSTITSAFRTSPILGFPAGAATRPSDLDARSPEGGLPFYDLRVQLVQSYLTALGYEPGPADGYFGVQTTNAIREYQKDRDLVADGQVSQALMIDLQRAISTDFNRAKAKRRPVAPSLAADEVCDELLDLGFATHTNCQ